MYTERVTRMVRRYEPFLVAEARLGSDDPASDGSAAFRALAGYLFGGNAAGERMAMTAPVISSTSGIMQFYVGGGRQASCPYAPGARCSPGVQHMTTTACVMNRLPCVMQLFVVRGRQARHFLVFVGVMCNLAVYCASRRPMTPARGPRCA